MRPLIIDLPGYTADVLGPGDSAALRGVVKEVLDPTEPPRDGAGFNNKL
jgi:hypothetical protein